MRGEPGEHDGASRGSAGPLPARWRAVGLAAGAVLAVAATVVVFLTDDPQVLRLAVVGGAWAFVLALLAAGRRRPGTDDAADLRRVHELELAREVAGRREYELETENRLRREADDAMRDQLAALRRDVAGLTALRSDVAALGALRQDVAALGALRQDVAALGALRQDMAALGGLRDEVARLAGASQELGQLAELRAELGRLRTELTEQLSSEMFLERVVMRTQSSRGPTGTVEGPGTRTIESVSWSDETPRELTGGWPAVRLDTSPPEPRAPEVPVTRGYEALQGLRAQQVAAASVASPAPSPRAREVDDDRSPRRRRKDDPATAEQLTVEQPRAAVQPMSELDAWPRPPAPLPPEPLVEPLTVQAPAVPTPGEARLAQILAESGATGSRSGRRRHRYRDDDEDDDVLARVLGRHQ